MHGRPHLAAGRVRLVQRGVTGHADQVTDMLALKSEPRTVIRPLGRIVAASLANAQELPNRGCVTGTEFVFGRAIHCEPYIIHQANMVRHCGQPNSREPYLHRDPPGRSRCDYAPKRPEQLLDVGLIQISLEDASRYRLARASRQSSAKIVGLLIR
jgi:hypothetical protein